MEPLERGHSTHGTEKNGPNPERGRVARVFFDFVSETKWDFERLFLPLKVIKND